MTNRSGDTNNGHANKAKNGIPEPVKMELSRVIETPGAPRTFEISGQQIKQAQQILRRLYQK
jgi:hypothetical protein